jgi:uncharacterized RDD family membrane protein YckC
MTTGPEAGYYADPSIPGYIRYWDGTQWVPGTSRPAPDQAAPEPEVPAQQAQIQQAPAQQTPVPQAVAEQHLIPQQQQVAVPEPSAAQAAEVREQLVAAAESAVSVTGVAASAIAVSEAVRPAEADAAPDAFEQTQSVATMVVPSAFGNRSGYTSGGWSGGPGISGYDSSPYAAVPGLNGEPQAAEKSTAAQVRVVELASAGSRVLARIIDLAVAAVLSAPATAVLLLIAHRHDHAYVERLRLQAKTTYRTLGMDATGIGLWAAALLVLLFTVMCFDAFRLSRSGQTTGRRLVGVQVVTADTASTIGGGAAFARAFLFWILALLPVIDIAALGGVLWGRPYRQGLHEKLTRTISIKA